MHKSGHSSARVVFHLRGRNLRFANGWGLEVDDTVWADCVDALLTCVGVDGTKSVFVVGLWHDAIVQEGRVRVMEWRVLGGPFRFEFKHYENDTQVDDYVDT